MALYPAHTDVLMPVLTGSTSWSEPTAMRTGAALINQPSGY